MPVPMEGLCNTLLCDPPACCPCALADSGAGEARLLGTGLFCKPGDAVSPVCSPVCCGSASLAPGPRGGGESGPSLAGGCWAGVCAEVT